jgi:acyl-ACP thioesterase
VHDPLPARDPGARAYRQPRRPGFADCAPSGRVRLDALARWLQDVAYDDVEEAGLERVAVWVVRRTRLRVNRFPRVGERFELTTFCSGLGRMWAERRTRGVRPRPSA